MGSELAVLKDQIQTIKDARKDCRTSRDHALEELEKRMRKTETDLAVVTQRVATGAAIGALVASVLVQVLFKVLG